MKVSIITATYNSQDTIQSCIDSIHSQNYENIEHIVVDGNSTDNTLSIIKSNKNIKLISEKDSGVYEAMNKGLKMASGDIIGILNSDDLLFDSTIIEKVVKNIGNYDSLFGSLYFVKRDNTNKITRVWKSSAFKKYKFKYGWMLPHPTLFLKKQIYEKYGMFRTDLKFSADYELMLRFLYKNNITAILLSEFMVKMREGGISNMSLKNRIMANKEDRRSWEINGLKMPLFLPILKPLRKVFQFLILKK